LDQYTALVKQQKVYAAQQKEVRSLTETYSEMMDVYAASLVKGSAAAKELKQQQQKQKEQLSAIVTGMLEYARTQGSTNKEIGEYAFQTAKSAGFADTLAATIRDKVVKALEMQEARLQSLQHTNDWYSAGIIENAQNSVKSLKLVSDVENKIFATFKTGMENRAKQYLAGELTVESYRKNGLEAEIGYTQKIVAARETLLNELLKKEGNHQAEILKVQRQFVAAKGHLEDLVARRVDTTYKTKLNNLKAAHNAELKTDAEFYVQKFNLEKKELERQIAINEDAQVKINKAGTTGNAVHVTLLEERAKLNEKYSKLLAERSQNARNVEIREERAALQVIIQDKITQLATLVKLGEGKTAAASSLMKEINTAQEKSNALRLKINEDFYKRDLSNLNMAYATRSISLEQYNRRRLQVDQKHWQKVIQDATANINLMKNMHLEYTDKYLEFVKTRDDAIIASAAAQDTYTASVIDGYKRMMSEGTSVYEQGLIDLKMQYDEGERSSKQYLTKQLNLYITWKKTLISAQKEVITGMVAEGATSDKLSEARLKLAQMELDLADALEHGKEKIEEVNNVLGVSEEAWDTFAKKLGITKQKLQDLLKPYAKASAAGKAAANVSAAAWKAFADKLHMTVSDLKKAVAEALDEVEKGYVQLDGIRRKQMGPMEEGVEYTYIGGKGYFEQYYGIPQEMAEAEMDAAMKSINKIIHDNQDQMDVGGWWKEFNNNIQLYKVKLSDAMVALDNFTRKEKEAAKNAAATAAALTSIDAYNKRIAAHEKMTASLISDKEALLSKMREVAAMQKTINASIAAQEHDIAREGMSITEQYADDKKQVEDLLSAARQAAARKDFEVAQALLQQALEANAAFNKKYVETAEDGSTQIIASERTVRDMRIQFLKEISKVNDKVAQESRDKTAKEVEHIEIQLLQAKDAADILHQSILDLQELINSDWKIDIDARDAFAAITDLQKDTESTHTIKVKTVQTNKEGGIIVPDPVVKAATGGFLSRRGKLSGYGGGDRVRSLLEPGEFIMRKESVKKYGANLFSSYNKMRVSLTDKAKSTAASVGAAITPTVNAASSRVAAMAAGGSVLREASVGERIQLDFNINDKIYSVDAEKEVGTALINELKLASMVC